MEKMICRQGMADTSQAWIYYKESGRGTPILMLHGNAETHLIFDYYEKKLSMKYRVILMDSRAHGRSRIKPEYAESEFTTTDMARDAAAASGYPSYPVLYSFWIQRWGKYRLGIRIPVSGSDSCRDCHQRKCLTGWTDSSCPGFLCGEILLSESSDKSVPGNLQKKSCRFLHPFMSFPSSAARFPALQFSHDVPGAA